MRTVKLYTYIACLAVAGLLFSCGDDFIDRPPMDTIVDANFYQSPEQLLAASAPLYNVVWFAYNDKASHGIGDGRGGTFSANYSYQLENIQFRTTSVTDENSKSWRAFFNVVGQANTLINNINKYAAADIPEQWKNHAIAEARFMRGVAYSFLVQNYGPVPIITDNIEILQDTTVTRNTVESVWEFITRDIRYGTMNLPDQPVQPGRLTKWSAHGMLAKMYLTRAGVNASSPTSRNQMYLDSAKYLAQECIKKSGAKLMDNYEDLFKIKNNNNSESLFALQWKYDGSNWGSQNSVQAFLAFSGSITGFSDGWGGDLGASMYMLSQYDGLIQNGTTTDTRRKATFMFPGDFYPYITNLVLDENGNPVKEPLTVPLNASGFNERAWVKKYVVGRPEDNEGKVAQQRTEINTYMLRLPDVYLVYAEAAIGNGTQTNDADAIDYFNKIRVRAGVAPITNGILTREQVLKERVVEFAMEGQLWYDYVRMWYYDPQGAYAALSSQDRGFIRITPNQFPNPTKWTITAAAGGPERFYTVTSANFQLPIPEVELTKAPNLRKAAVPYVFN